MAEETGVTEDVSSPETTADTPQDGETGGGGHEESVPYDRFQQVNESKKELETRLQQESEESKNLWQQNQTLQQMLARQQELSTPAKQPESDPLEGVRGAFGDDAEGQAAFEAVRRTTEILAERKMREAMEERDKQWEEKFNSTINAVTGSITAQQQIGELKSRGVLTDETEAKLKHEMATVIQADPRYQQHPELTRKVAIANLAERGELVRAATPERAEETPGNPTGLRGSNMQESQRRREAEDAELSELRRKFPSLRGYNPKSMRAKFGALAETRPEDDEMVQTSEGPMPQFLHTGAAFTHRRDDV